MTEYVRGHRADHRGTRTRTILPAPEQFYFYANAEIQLISAFFKAIQAYSNLFKEKTRLPSVTTKPAKKEKGFIGERIFVRPLQPVL
jgi:hypothetical protein